MKRFVIVAAIALSSVGSFTPAARAATGGLVETTVLASAMSSNARHLDSDPSARRLFEIGRPKSGPGMSVAITDLDSLKRIATIKIPDAQSGFGGYLSSVDEFRHRLFVLYPLRPADDQALGTVKGAGAYELATKVIFAVAVIDTIHARLLGSAAIPYALPADPIDASQGNSIGMRALSYFAPEDKLYLVAELPAGVGDLSVSNHVVVLHQIDVPRLLANSTTALDWSYALPQCAMSAERDSGGVVFRRAAAPEIFIPCRTGALPGSPFSQPLETPGVVRVRITPGAAVTDTSSFATEFFPISGNMRWGLVAVDPIAERLFLQADGSTTEAGAWVFDAASASWLGFVVYPAGFASGRIAALAVDRALGRLYTISTAQPAPSLHLDAVLAASRANGADQGLIYSARIRSTPYRARSVVDPLRRRIFVAAQEGYAVLEDRTPVPALPRAARPDLNTIDAAVGNGTAVNFLGGSRSYGARLKIVGGTNGIAKNVNILFDNPPFPEPPQELPATPSDGTRDVDFARVLGVTLTGDEATAKASGGDRDSNTDADLLNATQYVKDHGGPDQTQSRWPYEAAACTDFGNPKDKQTGSASGASVKCDRAAASVRATASNADPVTVSGPEVHIARATSGGGVRLDAKRGVVSYSTAEVRGLDLGGMAGVGRIVARAESWATGRPRASNGVGAGSSFARTFEDVWVANADGSHTTLCTSPCGPELVRDALHTAFGSRVQIDLPVPDKALAAGTPGGYEALVARNPFERLNEISVNDEAGIRLEVPAIVVTLFFDGRTRSRVVASLAAVSAESHYGIYRLSRSISGGPPSIVTRTPPIGRIVPRPPGSAGGPAPAGVPALIRKVLAGVRFAFSTPARSARTAGFLLFLAAPLVLLARRRTIEDDKP